MEYQGQYDIFDSDQIKTYPLKERSNKVSLESILSCEAVKDMKFELAEDVVKKIESLASEIISANKNNQPVLFFTGAHLIKNGLSKLLIDLIERGVLSSIAGNCATAIHDFELALIGQTSEDVPMALEKGQFGMAYEFAYINTAISVGNELKLGLGESLGKMIRDEKFRELVFSKCKINNSVENFSYPEVSVLAKCYEKKIPFTIHAGIGTDVIDQHSSFDGQAKGGCSGRDFLIFTDQVAKLTNGGTFVNVGSAVTGPEVLLKAASMAANINAVPDGLITADFDIREFMPTHMKNETAHGYYFRDQKSIVTRVPQAFGGKGYYIQGNQKHTFPFLYKKIIEKL